MNSESCCIPRRKRLLGQTTKHQLSNFEPWTLWRYMQLWGLRPDPSCLLKKKSVKGIIGKAPLKVFLEMLINSWAKHRQQIKVDSSSSRNKLYSTFAVYRKTLNLARISDRYKVP